jgi:hypothetical protein
MKQKALLQKDESYALAYDYTDTRKEKKKTEIQTVYLSAKRQRRAKTEAAQEWGKIISQKHTPGVFRSRPRLIIRGENSKVKTICEINR